ncbi:MAG: alpha/beta hydrolase [Thiohalocapsa sp.]
MNRRVNVLVVLLGVVALTAGCASKPRQLMPTPVLYQQPGGPALLHADYEPPWSTDVDLLYVTDRAVETSPESDLPYGEDRARHIAFGTARVRIGPGMSWPDLRRESQLAERTRDTDLVLGRVSELGRFPTEPYEVRTGADGAAYRDRDVLQQHERAKQQLRGEVRRRLENAPKREVLLYVHGFNETFETAAFTTAELCHFLGRESVCTFFTWPASSTGNFLTSYTATTESADYAVTHLKKMIRMLATAPGVERVQLLAHSRGTALLLKAVRELFIEVIAAGKEPGRVLNIDNIVMFSPDIDVDVGAQQITGFSSDPDLISVWPSGRLPRTLQGRLTIYSSPRDRALLVSRILFRSRNRIGELRAEDIPDDAQQYLARLGKIDIIVYEGKRTDAFGHSYFTTNPRVSADVIQLLRYDKGPGEPGRDLRRVGPVTWEFPPPAAQRARR